MRGKYIIALSDAHGHYHLIYTQISSSDETKKLNAILKKWHPKLTPNPPYGEYISQEEIFSSLKELTGKTFKVFKPNFYRSYGGNYINLPDIYDWKEK